jgi:hypothetical protein
MHKNGNQDGLMVKQDDGTAMQFLPSPEGLYYYDFLENIKRKLEQEMKRGMKSH